MANNKSLLHQLLTGTSNTSVPSKPSTSLCSTRLSHQVTNIVPQNHMYTIKSNTNANSTSVNEYSSFETPIEETYIPDIKSEIDLDECEISLEDPFKNHDADKQSSIQIEKPSNTASSSVPGTERLQRPQEPCQLTSHTSNTSFSGEPSFPNRSTTQFSILTNSSSLSDFNLFQYLVKKFNIKDLTVRVSRLSDQVLDSLQQNGTVDCNVVDSQMSEQRHVRIKLEPVTVDPCVCDDQVSVNDTVDCNIVNNQMSEQRNVLIKLEPVTVDPCVCNDQVLDNLQQNLSSTVDDDDIEVPFEAIYDPLVKCEPDLVKTEPSSDFTEGHFENNLLEIGNAKTDSVVQPDLQELKTSAENSNPSSNKDVDTSAPVFLCTHSNLLTNCESKITSRSDNQRVKVSGYKCQECIKCYKHMSELRRHISHVHPNKCSYKCPLCKRGFNLEKYLNAHIKFHDKILQCDVCGKILSTKQKLTEHKMTIHTKSSPLSCDMCSKILYTETSLKAHTKAVHSNLSYKCDICDKSFKLKFTLRTHQREVHASVRAFSCNQCEKTFVSKYTLQQHSVVHSLSDLRPFKCKKCGSCFNRSGDLATHIRTVHSSERAFKCHLCGKCFKRKKYIKIHLIRHSDVRNYKCGQCGKHFKSKDDLKRHLLSHGEIRPFACAECHKKFKYKSDLVRHLRQVHSDLRPFSCDKCSFAFKSKSHLKRHQLVHSNVRKFECCHCNSKFKYRYCLSVHTKTKHPNLMLPAIL